ncbi:MAG: S8 family serine peptidase [Candidatus Nanopelagicales bacterium]
MTRLIVRTRDGKPLSSAGLVAAGRLAGSATTPATRAMSRGQSLVYLGTALTTAEAYQAAAKLAARADVVWAEPDLPVYASDASPVTLNDPLFGSQWDAWDTSLASGGNSTRVPQTWLRTKGDPSVVVAVLDTGLTAHPDITTSVAAPAASDPIVKGYDFIAGDPDFGGKTFYVANDGNGRDADPSDPGDWITDSDAAGNTAGGLFLNCFADPSSWHGTHVTGTIVAKQNNSVGITGIAPGVKVQPVRVLGRCGGYSSDINDAIEWASGGHIDGIPDNATPAQVINMSLGGPGSCLASTQQAINDARGRGTTVVVAAGNEGHSLDPNATSGSQPADCDGVVRVTATTRTGTIATYSNTGSVALPATIAAPGGSGAGGSNDILSTINTGTTVPASASYTAYAGTSMATPHVAAAVALLQSTRVGRTPYTPAQIETQLTAAARPFTPGAGPGGANCSDAVCGAGILDLSALPTNAPLAPTASVLPDTHSLSVSWTPGDSGGLAVTYDVETSPNAPGTWTTKISGTSAASGSVTGLVDGTPYYVRVTATNSKGSATSAVVGPVTPSSYAVLSPSVVGGVERLAVTWQAPSSPPTAVTGYALRYRAVGGTDWTTVSALASDTAKTLTPWPSAALPAGQYEVQVAALHDAVTIDNAATDADWSPSLTATTTSLLNRTTVSATTLRPFKDGYQDSVVVRVATNRPGGASGQLRILNSARVPVRIVALGAASSWSYVWTGLSSRNLRVPNGRYYLQAYLPDATGALVAVANPPSVVVASSQAARPTITLSSTLLYPYRDGYKDTITVASSALVPSVMTWKIIRSGKTYWQTTFTRRGTAKAIYGGAKIGGGVLPAGTYGLYVYAKGGEGTTVVSAKVFTVYAKKAVKSAFRVTYSAYAAGQATFSAPGNEPSTDGVRVGIPNDAAVTFLGTLPTTVLPYSTVRVTVTTYLNNSSLRGLGFYGGAPDTPNAIRPVQVTSNSFTSPTAPTVSYIGGKLRWYAENDSTASSLWVISSFTLSGYRWVLV